MQRRHAVSDEPVLQSGTLGPQLHVLYVLRFQASLGGSPFRSS